MPSLTRSTAVRKPAQNDKNGMLGLKPDLPHEVGVRQLLGRTCRSIRAFASDRFRQPPTLARPSSNVNNQSQAAIDRADVSVGQ